MEKMPWRFQHARRFQPVVGFEIGVRRIVDAPDVGMFAQFILENGRSRALIGEQDGNGWFHMSFIMVLEKAGRGAFSHRAGWRLRGIRH